MFRDEQPLAWSYHHNSSRWTWTAAPEAHASAGQAFKEYPGAKLLSLPEPVDRPFELMTAIRARRSCRAFGADALAIDALAALLEGSYGLLAVEGEGVGERFRRPVPSGGGLYALELYLLSMEVEGVSPGVWHYHPLHHALEQVDDRPLAPAAIHRTFLEQAYLASAGAIVVITAVPGRSLWRYGDRGYRYLLLEAGHVAQNLGLIAASLGVGSLALGGFLDAELAALLGVDPEEEFPVYGVALGRAVGGE